MRLLGDVLYMPRGVPHDAATSDVPSLHLTFGVDAQFATWADVLNLAAQRHDGALKALLNKTLSLAADELVEVRRWVPPKICFRRSEANSLRFGAILNAVLSLTKTDRFLAHLDSE
jgi:hypothetical protein